MDGRKLQTNPNPSWMGYSVGQWEGDTLVVGSNGFIDKTWLAGRFPHTEALHMTERYRRTDLGHLELEVTFDDPGTYSKPWVVRVGALLTADTEMLEAYCDHVQNHSLLEHLVGKQSDDAKSAVKVDPEVLTNYVGVYKGLWAGRPRVVVVTLSEGSLFVAADGREQQPLYPRSPVKFNGAGLAYEFVRDEHGAATHVIETHASGDYKYERQQ